MTGLYDRFYRVIIPPVLDAVSGYKVWLERLRRSQFSPPGELERRQEYLLRTLCEYAFRHVPLFKKLGGTPSFSDPAELPIVSKRILRQYRSLAVSDEGAVPFGHKVRTSGSTGEPLESFTDRRSDGLRLASRYLFDEWIGLHLGDRCSRIMAIPNRFSRLLANEQHIPLGSITSKSAPGILKQIFRFGPAGITGHPSSLALLAEARTSSDVTCPKSMASCIATAESLLEPMRMTISDAFRCPVYNRYGMKEVSGYLAQECRIRRGLHVNPEHVMLEIVDNGQRVPDGRAGRIIVTDLHNRVMPLIRYDTGDIGILSPKPCECGITWPLLESIQGRETDFVTLKDNSRFPAAILVGGFARSFIKAVTQVQFVLKTDGLMLVRVLPTRNLAADDVRRMREYLSRYLSTFEVELVNQLAPTRSGKQTLVIRDSTDRVVS